MKLSVGGVGIVDFCDLAQPLEGGPGLKLPEQQVLDNAATVLYIGRIPHGFYEKEIEGRG